MKIYNKDIYYNNLYAYKRDIPVEYIEKFQQFIRDNDIKLNLHDMKNNISKYQFSEAVFKHLPKNDNYLLYHKKLITIDILINKSFSFKCIKTNNIYRSKKCFHQTIECNRENPEKTTMISKFGKWKSVPTLKYDDVIIYIFDNIKIPFMVAIGNGSNWGALENSIYFIYYYTLDECYYFKNYLTHYLDSVEKICNNILNYYNTNVIPESTKISTTLGFIPNIGHSYWNDLTGFYFLFKMDLLKYVDKFIIGPHDYYNLYYYLLTNNYNVIREFKIENINNILNNEYILFKYNDLFMYEDLKLFILDNNNLLDYEEKTLIEDTKKNYYPIITLNLRAVQRYIYNQEDVYIKIINHLLLLFPNMFLIFDGYVKNNNVTLDNYNCEGFELNENKFDEYYNDILHNIIKKINTKNFVSLIGSKLDRQLAWLDISNYGVMQLGAGAFNYVWLMNKKCLFIGRNAKINDELLLHTMHDFYYRENRDFTTYVYPEFIDFESYSNENDAFSIDWYLLFFHILRDILVLEKNNYNLSQFENIKKYNIYMNFGLKVDFNYFKKFSFYDACNRLKRCINLTF